MALAHQSRNAEDPETSLVSSIGLFSLNLKQLDSRLIFGVGSYIEETENGCGSVVLWGSGCVQRNDDSGSKSAADRAKAGETDGYGYCADHASIKKADEIVTMSDLFDYKAARTEGGGAPTFPMKTERGYNCQNQKSQATKTTWYSGRIGTETGYMSGWGAYYLGMNYPLRFVLFGGLLTVCALSLETHAIGQRFFRNTLVMGLLSLFISPWIMSIFGNYGAMHSWERAKQSELFHWLILCGVAAMSADSHSSPLDLRRFLLQV